MQSRCVFSRACVAALVLAVLGVLALAAPAGAAPATRFTGAVQSGSAGPQVTDGTCPDATDPSFPPGTEEPHQVWTVTAGEHKRLQTITLDLCWAVTGALGGESLDIGTFTSQAANGTLTGTVSGFAGFALNIDFVFTLHITGGTGQLAHAKGDLVLSGCQQTTDVFAGPVLTASLGTAFSGTFPPVCFAS